MIGPPRQTEPRLRSATLSILAHHPNDLSLLFVEPLEGVQVGTHEVGRQRFSPSHTSTLSFNESTERMVIVNHSIRLGDLGLQ